MEARSDGASINFFVLFYPAGAAKYSKVGSVRMAGMP